MTVTALGRGQIEWPDLGTAGGAALETAIHGAVKTISDNLTGRYEAGITLANAASTQYEHNFNLPSEDLEVILYDTTSRKRLTLDTGDNGLTVSHIDNDTIEIANSSSNITFDLLIVAKSSLRSTGQTRHYAETTDATQTAIASRAILNGSGEMLTAVINGHRQSTGNSAAIELKYRVKNNSNTLTLTLMEKTADKDVSGWDANMTISGTTVLVNVIGEAGLVRWNCVLSNTKL